MSDDGDYPLVMVARCLDEENRGRYGLLRPEQEVWRVRIKLSKRCSGFLSSRYYTSAQAARTAAKRISKTFKQPTGEPKC